MILEVNTFSELQYAQPILNTFFSKECFPKSYLTFGLFPEENMTLYSRYNNYLSPVFLTHSETLNLCPPQALASLFFPFQFTSWYKFDSLKSLGERISFEFKKQDSQNLDYFITTRKARYDLHALDSGGDLMSLYCQGLSLDFLFKPQEGVIQVASTKRMQFKKNNKKFIYWGLKILKNIIIEEAI